MTGWLQRYHVFYSNALSRLAWWDGLGPLAVRAILVPVLWMAGSRKIDFATLLPHDSVVTWFGNLDWGLGLPLPTLMAFLAGWTELLGAVLLTVGLAVRWISLPLMITMVVAAATAHWDNGWQAIADPSAPFANQRVMESVPRLERAKQLLREHGNYSWLTGRGSLVILNNGIEFAAIYTVMLLTLLFNGGGRFTSLDDWLRRYWQRCQRA